MKHGPEYAKRLKRLFGEMTRKFGRPAPAAEAEDPVEQLVIGILSACTTRARAEAVFKKLREQVVDLNELRVTPAVELAEMIGTGVPLGREKAHRIVEALNAIRRRQDSLDITFLKQRGRREAREYLESLEGVGPAAAAHVVLYGLGGHAIPVDDLTLYVLQKDEILENGTAAAEAQAFLERQITSSEARLFCDLLSRHVSAKGARIAVEKLGDLLRPPPPAKAPAHAEAKDAKKAVVASVAAEAPTSGNSKKAPAAQANHPAMAASKTPPAHAGKSGGAAVAVKKPAAKPAEHKPKPATTSHSGANNKGGANRKKK